ncbi:hypothetical protein niasHT_021843 [Heterodera trifolii]|uniref:G-protein coupled receptors family 1 profile domain-containing protein n=1 Tax=Heterodera trifolii TaxID=157864 RepID=A0ABD2KI75_9BILA
MENPLFFSSLFRWLLSLPGLLFNGALLHTIICQKSLRSTCSTLLAIGSFLDIVSLLTFSVTFVVTLSGQNFISLFTCYFLQLLPNLSIFSSVWIVFFVGFDRLIAVLFPLRCNLLEKHLLLYISPMLFVTFGYSIYMVVMAANWALFTYPDWPVLCTNSDAFAFGMAAETALRNGLLIDCTSFLFYILVAIVLIFRWKKMSGSEMDKHRLFKSLSAIMLFVVGSYFSICVFVLLASSMPSQPFFTFHAFPSILALLTCVAASSNAPLLFIFSKDYRLAFRKQFAEWPLIGKWLNRIGNVQVNVVRNVNMNVSSTIPL